MKFYGIGVILCLVLLETYINALPVSQEAASTLEVAKIQNTNTAKSNELKNQEELTQTEGLKKEEPESLPHELKKVEIKESQEQPVVVKEGKVTGRQSSSDDDDDDDDDLDLGIDDDDDDEDEEDDTASNDDDDDEDDGDYLDRFFDDLLGGDEDDDDDDDEEDEPVKPQPVVTPSSQSPIEIVQPDLIYAENGEEQVGGETYFPNEGTIVENAPDNEVVNKDPSVDDSYVDNSISQPALVAPVPANDPIPESDDDNDDDDDDDDVLDGLTDDDDDDDEDEDDDSASDDDDDEEDDDEDGLEDVFEAKRSRESKSHKVLHSKKSKTARKHQHKRFHHKKIQSLLTE